MKILLSGGAGYLGSVLSGYLLEENHQVTVVDNFLYESSEKIWGGLYSPRYC